LARGDGLLAEDDEGGAVVRGGEADDERQVAVGVVADVERDAVDAAGDVVAGEGAAGGAVVELGPEEEQAEGAGGGHVGGGAQVAGGVPGGGALDAVEPGGVAASKVSVKGVTGPARAGGAMRRA